MRRTRNAEDEDKRQRIKPVCKTKMIQTCIDCLVVSEENLQVSRLTTTTTATKSKSNDVHILLYTHRQTHAFTEIQTEHKSNERERESVCVSERDMWHLLHHIIPNRFK